MATILKVEDDDKSTQIEVYPFDEDQLLTIWAKDGGDHYIDVTLDKQEVEELVEYLQKQLKVI